MNKKTKGWIFWTPRVLAILFVLFLAMFSLDVFDEKLGFWGTIIGLFMHNLPALILLVILIISWKREIIAGVAFILAGFLYVALISSKIFTSSFEWYMLSWILTIAGPSFLVGVLFIIGWSRRKTAMLTAVNPKE
jgi:hypothetical protein